METIRLCEHLNLCRRCRSVQKLNSKSYRMTAPLQSQHIPIRFWGTIECCAQLYMTLRETQYSLLELVVYSAQWFPTSHDYMSNIAVSCKKQELFTLRERLCSPRMLFFGLFCFCWVRDAHPLVFCVVCVVFVVLLCGGCPMLSVSCVWVLSSYCVVGAQCCLCRVCSFCRLTV